MACELKVHLVEAEAACPSSIAHRCISDGAPDVCPNRLGDVFLVNESIVSCAPLSVIQYYLHGDIRPSTTSLVRYAVSVGR
jgi:hypothetical protein